MSRSVQHLILATVTLVAVGVDQIHAQDAEVEVVVVADDAGEVAKEAVEVEVELVEEEVADFEVVMQQPVDNNLLKLRRDAQVECALVRRVCELTDEQTKQLAEINNKWVDKIGQKPNRVVNRQQQPGLLAMFFGAQPVPQVRAGPQLGVHQAVAKHIDEVLTDEQQKLYEAARQERLDFRHDAIADALIECLQERLGMTDEQRAAIKERILPWVAKQNLQTMHYFSGNNYYPEIPLHLLSKDLSKDQIAAYSSLQRYMFTDDNFNDGQVPVVIEQ